MFIGQQKLNMLLIKPGSGSAFEHRFQTETYDRRKSALFAVQYGGWPGGWSG